MLDPVIQTAVLGLVVKIAVDLLKKYTIVLDAEAKTYKVPVQYMVAICSALAALGQLYLTGKLDTLNWGEITTFLITAVPVYLNALGIHLFASDVKNASK